MQQLKQQVFEANMAAPHNIMARIARPRSF